MTSQPARITATVTIDLFPKPGQTAAEAASEFRALFQEYLEHSDGPLWEDYGATLADIQEAQENGEWPVWGGYEGPYMTAVSVQYE